jgi:aminotransferase
MSSAGTALRLLRGDVVPFLSPSWGPEEWATLAQWQAGATFDGAPERLEQAMADRLGGNVRVHASSYGRVAVSTALEALDLPAGSEVLLPSFSCSALIMAVHQAGAAPVLVDVDEDLNISAESVDAAWGPAVRAVIAPHVGGLWAASLPDLVDLCRERGALLIEDVAHALGLVVDGRPAGTSGDAAIFSTGTGKPLFGPGGGLLAVPTSSDLRPRPLDPEPRDQVAARVQQFVADYRPGPIDRLRQVAGIVRGRLAGPPTQALEGFRFTPHAMSDVEARIATIQLGRLDAMISARQAHAERWRELLGGSSVVVAPRERNTCVKFWARCATDADAATMRRALLRQGVETESLWTPLHLRPAFAAARHPSLPVTEASWRRVFSLPVRPNLPADAWARATAAIAAVRS